MNQVNLIGRITKELELKGDATKFLNFNLAVNREFVKEGEERQADFISCKAFGKTAEFIYKYMQKGTQIAVNGRIQTGSYDKEGTKVYTTDVIVNKVYFADGKRSDNAEQQGTQKDGFYPIGEGEEELPF